MYFKDKEKFNDFSKTKNLAEEYPEKFQEMKGAFEQIKNSNTLIIVIKKINED